VLRKKCGVRTKKKNAKYSPNNARIIAKKKGNHRNNYTILIIEKIFLIETKNGEIIIPKKQEN